MPCRWAYTSTGSPKAPFIYEVPFSSTHSFTYPEDVGSRFFQNAGNHWPHYMASHPRTPVLMFIAVRTSKLMKKCTKPLHPPCTLHVGCLLLTWHPRRLQTRRGRWCTSRCYPPCHQCSSSPATCSTTVTGSDDMSASTFHFSLDSTQYI